MLILTQRRQCTTTEQRPRGSSEGGEDAVHHTVPGYNPVVSPAIHNLLIGFITVQPSLLSGTLMPPCQLSLRDHTRRLPSPFLVRAGREYGCRHHRRTAKDMFALTVMALSYGVAAPATPNMSLPLNRWPMIQVHDSATGYLALGNEVRRTHTRFSPLCPPGWHLRKATGCTVRDAASTHRVYRLLSG